MGDLPGSGIEPVSPALAGRFLFIVPREKSSYTVLKWGLIPFQMKSESVNNLHFVGVGHRQAGPGCPANSGGAPHGSGTEWGVCAPASPATEHPSHLQPRVWPSGACWLWLLPSVCSQNGVPPLLVSPSGGPSLSHTDTHARMLWGRIRKKRHMHLLLGCREKRQMWGLCAYTHVTTFLTPS